MVSLKKLNCFHVISSRRKSKKDNTSKQESESLPLSPPPPPSPSSSPSTNAKKDSIIPPSSKTLSPSEAPASVSSTTPKIIHFVTNTKIQNIPRIKCANASEYYHKYNIHNALNTPKGVNLHGTKRLHQNGYDGHDVKIAIIDGGIDASHDDLNDKVMKQTWFRYDDDIDTNGSSNNKTTKTATTTKTTAKNQQMYPRNTNHDLDHGTHIAGTIHLIAPQADLYDYRVLGKNGEVDTEEAICMSIYEACHDGCHVINLSLSCRWPSSNIRTAVQYAYEKGVFVICAVGNEGGGDDPLVNDISYPAMWDEVISVGAICKRKGFPTALFSTSKMKVDYAALGGSILSLKPGGGYTFLSGTSIACPHVSGFVAALLTKHKGINHEELRLLLDKFVIYVNRDGKEDGNVKLLTYLDQEEYEIFWKQELQESRDLNSFFHGP